MRRHPDTFWRHVEPEPNSGCWLWTASLGSTGYGQAFNGWPKSHGRRVTGAHRVAWELTHGEIPAGLGVLHRCDVPLCVNPQHLFLGTSADNLRDMRAKKRDARGEKHGRVKLTAAAVADIRRSAASGSTYDALAEQYEVVHNTISQICRGLTWRDVHTEHINPARRRGGLPKGTAPWWKPWLSRAKGSPPAEEMTR
jgi:hypothetical protein